MATKSNAPETFYDFISSFESGVNSGIEPLLLKKNQLAFGLNTSVRGAYVTHRPPFQIQNLSYADPALQAIVETGLFQGAGYYRPDYGPESLIAQISGHLILFTSAGITWNVTDISVPGDLNDASVKQVWMWQAERWMIIQDGTGALPIFFDGTASRRSYGPATSYGITAAPFTPPVIGGTISLSLTAAYTGPLNVPILLNGEFYQAIDTTCPPIPLTPTPTDLIATVSSGQVVLAWSAVGGATGYNVKRSLVSGGPYIIIASPTATTYTDITVANGTTYFYVVSAVGAGGESTNSAQVSATPTAIPTPVPTNLAFTTSYGHVNLTWTAIVGGINYHVKRSATSGGPYTTVGSATIATYTDTTVVNGVTYFYVVSAVDVNGESTNSAQVSATPPIPPPPIYQVTLTNVADVPGSPQASGSKILAIPSRVGFLNTAELQPYYATHFNATLQNVCYQANLLGPGTGYVEGGIIGSMSLLFPLSGGTISLATTNDGNFSFYLYSDGTFQATSIRCFGFPFASPNFVGGQLVSYVGNTQPTVQVGTLSGSFAVPPVGASITVPVTQLYTGADNKVVWINNKQYLISKAPTI